MYSTSTLVRVSDSTPVDLFCWFACTADILLNVFLAIAVDNLADAQSLTILEQEQIELKAQRKQMRELKRREREDRHRRERAAGIRKESSSSSSDEEAIDDPSGAQGGPGSAQMPSASPRPSGMMGMGMMPPPMPPPMPCFLPGLADMPPPMPVIPPELLEAGPGGASPFPPGFMPPPMPPPMPVIPFGASGPGFPLSPSPNTGSRASPLSPLSPGFQADGCGGSSDPPESTANGNGNASTPNPIPTPILTPSPPAAGTTPNAGAALSTGTGGALAGEAAAGAFNFGLVTEPQLPPPTEMDQEVEGELGSDGTGKHMMRPRRMTELNLHEKIRPIPNASAFFILSPTNPYVHF